MQLRRTQPTESRELSQWVKERHYTKRTPPGYIAALEFLDGKNRIGAMLLGRPASRGLDACGIVELTRMYFVDEAPKNTESQALSLMRRFVRVWMPGTKLLVAYSDPNQGHKGTVYEADGWARFSMTGKKSGYGWKSRPNRNDDPVTSKQRWVRTP